METQKHTQSRFNVSFIDFIRPDSFWPYPYSIEQAFQTFRWMVETGNEYRGQAGRYSAQNGVRELLSKKPSCLEFRAVSPITSLDDLRERFHYAILSNHGHPTVDQWRNDFDVLPTGKATIRSEIYRDAAPHPVFNGHRSVDRTLKSMFEPPINQKMAVALNSIHRENAIQLHNVHVSVRPGGFSFELNYGDARRNEISSQWTVCLARSQKDETFIDTLARADINFNAFVHGIIPDTGLNLRDTFQWDVVGEEFVLEQIEALTLQNKPRI